MNSHEKVNKEWAAPLRILHVVGARPNFMKVAPLYRAFSSYSGIEQLIVHTGQHYDDELSAVFFKELCLPKPDVNLNVGSGARDIQIQTITERFEPVVRDYSPNLVIVVGDVNSTVAAARVARLYNIKVAHVEAGLRSFDLSMPEEVNRIETDKLSDYLFVTEESGVKNLEDEQVCGQVHLVGNVMIDTLVHQWERVQESSVLLDLSLRPGQYFVGTFHRPSNVDRREDLLLLISLLEEITKDLPLVLPLHPRTRASLERSDLFDAVCAINGLIISDPLGYRDFLKLLSHAKAVFTDSGGIQEEATYLGVPCLTMRENTERPITISLGTNELVGLDLNRFRSERRKIMQGEFKKGSIPPFWDSRSAERIARITLESLSSLQKDSVLSY